MARSETKRFLPPEERMAALMRALGHPARIAILKLLAERGAMPCFELVEELPLAQATISQHLRTLREVGSSRSRPTDRVPTTAFVPRRCRSSTAPFAFS